MREIPKNFQRADKKEQPRQKKPWAPTSPAERNLREQMPRLQQGLQSTSRIKTAPSVHTRRPGKEKANPEQHLWNTRKEAIRLQGSRAGGEKEIEEAETATEHHELTREATEPPTAEAEEKPRNHHHMQG